MGGLVDASALYDKAITGYSDNIDDLKRTGMFRLDESTSGTFPLGVQGLGAFLLVFSWDVNTVYQILYSHTMPDSIFKRTWTSGIYQGWYRFTGIIV